MDEKCWLYRPFSLRKSGIPLAVETPAPPKNTVCADASVSFFSSCAASLGSVIVLPMSASS